MANVSRITPQELPKLIAAAVQKALTERPITPEQLANLSKFPIRCGIFPYENQVGVGVAESHSAEPHNAEASALKLRPLPFGFILREFDLLGDLTQLKPLVGTEQEL